MKRNRELVTPNPKRKYRPTFLREWREHMGLSLERAAERIGEATGEGLSHAQLSRIERGEQPYSQAILEAAAFAYQTDPSSLLIRNPKNPEAIWSIWDNLKPAQRKQAIRLLKALAEEEAA